MELVLATHNAHKTREFRELLSHSFEIKDLSSNPEIVMPKETGATFEENAILKAASISKSMEGLVMADDSGLEVDALNGAPGIYSARYAGENADTANVDKLLRELTNTPKRSARFRCVIALARAGKVLATVHGTVEGTIIDQPRGNGGFGYDPVFQPIGFAETFAEMAPHLKNEISHRGKAAAALRERLREIAD
ncbi:MAG TPA: RdgB/HAM1 family non-canonical purine NTP pyrophosphatase [Chthoniobacterales bacterium]|nr:RdgB/HAM1 family non-canonical purine NTP pyrophosphatase [Chthoniobacterales bacterium]